MKKIVILILCLLIALVGFFLYKKVDQGIEAYHYRELQNIDYTQVKTLPVDEYDVSQSYTHQVTTYPLFEEELLTSVQHYVAQSSFEGLMVAYNTEDEFMINSFKEFSSVDKKVTDVHGAYVLVWSKNYTLKSGVQGKLYENDTLYFMWIQPKKVDSVWFNFDEFSLELVISDL